MTRQSGTQCLTPEDYDAAQQDGSNAGQDGRPSASDSPGTAPAVNSNEARVLAHAGSVPTPPASPSAQRPRDDDEVEVDVSSSEVRLHSGRLYLALPNVQPSGLDEEEIKFLIQRLEMDLKVAFGKIRAKSHRKPGRESSLFINMRMSGTLEHGATKVKLKPCIWFFCGSRWCRKIIEKDLKKLSWRLPCGLQIVDKGGPLLAASDDSDQGLVDDDRSYNGPRPAIDHCFSRTFEDGHPYGAGCHTDYGDSTCLAGPSSTAQNEPAFASGTSNYATRFDTTGDSEPGGSIPSPTPSFLALRPDGHWEDASSNGHWGDAPSVGTASSGAVSSHSRVTDVNNTIHRQRPPSSSYFLPCEFAKLTGCGRLFRGDEEDEWMDHIGGHLRGYLPQKLRCWFCLDFSFDANETSDGDRRLNFELRMQHIRDHIVYDGYSVSAARPDSFVIRHLKLHRLVDSQTWHSIVSRNVVLSGPGCRVATRRGSRASMSNRTHAAETSLELSNGMALEFHLQESSTNSSIGLVCRSTIRRRKEIISERFAKIGGVITVTRGSETILYGVTSGHSIVCQVLDKTPSGDGKSNGSCDGDSEACSGDSSSDQSSADNDSHSPDSLPVIPYENTRGWMNASQGLVATFVGLRADSMKVGMIPQETSVRSEEVAGDLALIQIPDDCVGWLQNDFIDPIKPARSPGPGKRMGSAGIEPSEDENNIFVLLGKTRSIMASRVAGTFHFSVGGRKVETERILLSEELGEYSHHKPI
ncbi:hypothetical protein Daus18300_007523 [Diaporthe australafricana]|uniref:C2H2-type domain-containing protein n=1 Tax=Diaporthe australafricana TaxID=127596 RepID=A0ABR3WM45_9PEZI